MEISNRLKRIITAIIGITVIILGLEYLPSISFSSFIDFSIHPLVLAALIIFFYEIFRQYLKNPNSRNSKYYIFCVTYIIFCTQNRGSQNNISGITGPVIPLIFVKSRLKSCLASQTLSSAQHPLGREPIQGVWIFVTIKSQ